MRFTLGIDVGTTAVKAALFATDGRMIRVASCPYPLYTPKPGWAEQDAEDWMRALRKSVRKATSGHGEAVDAIGLSSQGGTVVLLGRDGRPLCRALTWLDTRPDRLAQDCIPGLTRHEVYLTTGWSSLGALPLAKLFWLREYQKRWMKDARQIAFTGDYVIRRLTGCAAIDPSSAAITQLYDLKRRGWCERYLAAAGVSADMLPGILGSDQVVGGLLPPMARTLGLRSGIPIVTGAHDQYASAFGVDVRRPGDMLVATGTAWVQLAVSGKPAFVPDERIGVSPCAVGDLWGGLIAVSYGGASFNWLRDLCGLKGFGELDGAASECPVGSGGLRFIPARTLGGARGLFHGLDLSHSRGHVARAIMEGVAVATAENLRFMAARGATARRVVMTGGATESRVWAQIVADCVGKPIHVLGRFESACAGAARLAARGVGQDRGFASPAAGPPLKPTRHGTDAYRDLRHELVRLGKAIRDR
jgi:xylulokinase